MSEPPEPPTNPDDESERRRREQDTERIPRINPDDGPAFGAGSGYSDDPAYASSSSYSDYSDDFGYGRGPQRGGPRMWSRDPHPEEPMPEISAEELAGLGSDSMLPSGPRRVLPLEDEPTALVARYLFPTERYRGEWRRHKIYLAVPVLVGVAATFILGYLSGFLASRAGSGLTTLAVLLWLGAMGWVAWRVADWYFDRFILTNKRVMVVKGIITRQVAMMPLQRVTDMKYEQSPLGRTLNYGTFVLESAGQDQALREIKYLPNPNELYLRVVEEMYEPQAVEARLSKEAEEADDGA